MRTLLVDEHRGFPLPGFDCGNSPHLIGAFDLRGRTVIHTTSAETRGLAAASDAEELLTGSLVNARATAYYLFTSRPPTVTLAVMELEGNASAAEDVLCTRYIESSCGERL